jgi:hyperosmotically inducible periplasmic protein
VFVAAQKPAPTELNLQKELMRMPSTAAAQASRADSMLFITQRVQANSIQFHRRLTMMIRTALVAAVSTLALLAGTGCAVGRGQETTGAYVDDTTITTQIKSRFYENKDVAGSSISVETLNGTVMLSGFAKNATEKGTAEKIALDVNGVREVKNQIAVRP